MSTQRRHGVACTVAIWLAVSAAEGATILYVDDDAAPGGDGLGWVTAHRFLQSALATPFPESGAVTEIRVAGGVYRPDRTEAAPG